VYGTTGRPDRAYLSDFGITKGAISGATEARWTGTADSGSVVLHQGADLWESGRDVLGRAAADGTVCLEDGGALVPTPTGCLLRR